MSKAFKRKMILLKYQISMDYLQSTDKGIDSLIPSIENQEIANDFTFAGFIGMNTSINSIELEDLQQDPKVYLADTTGDRYFKGDINVDSTKRNLIQDNEKKGSFPQSLAWDLEDLGIIN